MKWDDVPVSEAMRNAGIMFLHNAPPGMAAGDVCVHVYQRMVEAQLAVPASPIVAGSKRPTLRERLAPGVPGNGIHTTETDTGDVTD